MTRKYAIHIIFLMIGLGLGYLFFGSSEEKSSQIKSKISEEIQGYTCSMHPQIKQPNEGKCPLCGMDLVISRTINNSSSRTQFRMTERALALANINTLTVGLDNNPERTLHLSGVITTNKSTDATQATIFEGRIEELNVNFIGDYVRKGQQIGVIYAPNMYEPQDRVRASLGYRESHPNSWDAARHNHGLWKLTDDQINQVIKTGKPIVRFPLLAEASGTVTEIMAKEGEFYSEGAPLYSISNLNTVWAIFEAYESQIPHLKMGQEVEVSSPSFTGKKLNAKIAFIEPVVNSERRTASVRVTLRNAQHFLKPGMLVEGEVEIEGGNEAITIPKSAVLWTGKRSLVYVKVNPDEPVFEMKEVTIGTSAGDSYEILDGLVEGEEIVVNGTFTVDAAAQLNGKKSMMSKPMKGENQSSIDLEIIEKKIDFDEKYQDLIKGYVELKNSLVQSDLNSALDIVTKFDLTIQNLIIQTKARERIVGLKKLQQAALDMKNTQDIAKLRLKFKLLSSELIEILDGFKGLDQTVYVQYCPMADNNNGAYWLSFESQIKNPYYGEVMLSCGSVVRKMK